MFYISLLIIDLAWILLLFDMMTVCFNLFVNSGGFVGKCDIGYIHFIWWDIHCLNLMNEHFIKEFIYQSSNRILRNYEFTSHTILSRNVLQGNLKVLVMVCRMLINLELHLDLWASNQIWLCLNLLFEQIHVHKSQEHIMVLFLSSHRVYFRTRSSFQSLKIQLLMYFIL